MSETVKFEEPPASRYEVFQFLARRWNVALAKELSIGTEVLALNRSEIESWMKMSPMIRVEDSEHPVNLLHPVLFAPVWDGAKKEWSGDAILIDGWHRLKEAFDTGAESLPARILSHETEEAVRVP